MEIIGIIEKRETDEGLDKNGAPYTRYVFTLVGGKKYSTFDAKIHEKFSVGQSIKIIGEMKGQYFNMSDMLLNDEPPKVVNMGQTMGKDLEIRPPKGTTTMYVSYAKDIFVALIEGQTETRRMPEGDIMDQAIALVKQAKEAFE